MLQFCNKKIFCPDKYVLEKSMKQIPLFLFSTLLQHRKVHILLKQQQSQQKTKNTDLFNPFAPEPPVKMTADFSPFLPPP